MLQCVAVCCSVWQCVAVCCSSHCSIIESDSVSQGQYVAVCCSVLQWFAVNCEVCCDVWQCVVVCCNILGIRRVPGNHCCSVLCIVRLRDNQHIAVCWCGAAIRSIPNGSGIHTLKLPYKFYFSIVLQVGGCYEASPSVTVLCCSVLQRVAACCMELQCVAVYCSVLQ